MKALVTGAGGFIGSHIVDFLLEKGMDVCATVFGDGAGNLRSVRDRIDIVELDINDREAVARTVRDAEPDYVFHMAAQAFVMPSWKDPEKTYDTNIKGTFNLLEALKNTNAVIGVACSSAAYGLSYENEIPLKEEREFRPSSPYAVSKAATDALSFLYSHVYGMKVVRLRFFNTIGPRKTGSAVADWAKGIAEIERGLKKELGVGNLKPVVDLIDIRDAVDAVWLLSQRAKWGDAYNICSGEGRKLENILDSIIAMSRSKITVFTDPAKLRPVDDSIFIGDNSKLKKIGWKPKVGFENTLQDTLDYWRNEIRNNDG